MKGHINEVSSIIELEELNYLVSGSLDMMLKIWILKTFQCETSINGIYCLHSNSIAKMKKNIILIGSFEMLVVFNGYTLRTEQLITLHKAWWILSLILLREGIILCGSNLGKIALCNLNTNSSNIMNKICQDSISSLISIDNNFFVVGSWDSNITLWQYKLGKNIVLRLLYCQ